MRMLIKGDQFDQEVIGEPFTIPGCEDAFAVHPTIGIDAYEAAWSATHVDTGLRIAKADSIDEAIACAVERWQAKTPEEIAAAKARAATLDGFRVKSEALLKGGK